MPELPEVETISRQLIESQILGSMIAHVKIFWPRIVDGDPNDFQKSVLGQTLVTLHRRGKYLIFSLSKGFLIVHLRMTGKMKLGSAADRTEKHDHLRLEFDNGKALSFNDTRKFGRWKFVETVELSLGIEPLSPEFTAKYLKNLIKNKKGPIKSFLLNQKNIAGLGNIYTDEALWHSQIHPLQDVGHVPTKKLDALHKAIVHVLTQGIQNKGTSLGDGLCNYAMLTGRGGNQNALAVYGREEEPCYRCQISLEKIVVAQRGTHFCPECQKWT